MLNAINGGTEVLSGEAEDRTLRKRQANKDKREAKKKRWAAERDELQNFRSGQSSQQKYQGSKGKGKGKSKDQTGSPLCFSWASGSGPCADVPPGGAWDQEDPQVQAVPLPIP